jgi:hypothetical protein
LTVLINIVKMDWDIAGAAAHVNDPVPSPPDSFKGIAIFMSIRPQGNTDAPVPPENLEDQDEHHSLYDETVIRNTDQPSDAPPVGDEPSKSTEAFPAGHDAHIATDTATVTGSEHDQPATSSSSPDGNEPDKPADISPDGTNTDKPADPVQDGNSAEKPADISPDGTNTDKPADPVQDGNSAEKPADISPDDDKSDKPVEPSRDDEKSDKSASSSAADAAAKRKEKHKLLKLRDKIPEWEKPHRRRMSNEKFLQPKRENFVSVADKTGEEDDPLFEPPTADGGVKELEEEKEDDCLTAGTLHRVSPSGPKCHKCGKVGHQKKNCPQIRACKLCSQLGHKAVECPRRICRDCGEEGHSRSHCTNKRCHTCGKQGHLKSNCPQRVCKHCQQKGHSNADCPERKRRRANCKNCSSDDHHTEFCTEPCTKCHQYGHGYDDCTNVELRMPEDALEDTQGGGEGSTKDDKVVRPAEEFPVADVAKDGNTNTPNNQGDDKSEDDAGDSDAEGEIVKTTKREQELLVGLDVEIHPHCSSCTLEFRASFPDSSNLAKKRTNVSSVRFTHHNIVGEITAVKLDKPSDQGNVPNDFDPIEPYLISFAYDPFIHGKGVLAKKTLGSGFFVNDGPSEKRRLGPFHRRLFEIQEMLNKTSTQISFVTMGTPYIQDKIAALNTSVKEQRAADPIYKWWPQQKIVAQRGMELPQGSRPSYKLRAKNQFDSWDEYTTVVFYNVIVEHEELVDHSHPVHTKVRFVEFPGGSDRVPIALIQMCDGLHNLRPDSILDVTFPNAPLTPSGDREKWRFVILEPDGWVNGQDYMAYAYRPHTKPRDDGTGGFSKFELDPRCFIKMKDFPTGNELAQKVVEMPGMRCEARVHVPKVGITRMANSVRHIANTKQEPKYATEISILLGNNTRDIPRYDYFWDDVQTYGQEKVDEVVKHVCTGLNLEQRKVFEAAQETLGGVLLVQGTGGVGKSLVARQFMKYQYIITVEEPVATRQHWFVAPLNSLDDTVANAVDQDLKNEYRRLNAERQDGDPPIRYPVVIRRYMKETEKWHYEEYPREQSDLPDNRPAYFREDNAEFLEMAHIVRTLDAWRAYDKRGPDKRFKLKHLAESTWLLRYAGYHVDEPGKQHPIANPGNDDVKTFRAWMSRMALGVELDAKEMDSLTTAANKCMADVAKLAQVIVMTPDVVTQFRAHNPSKPYAIFSDEAAKMSEPAALGCFVWARPYKPVVGAPGGILIEDGKPAFQIMLGDVFQLPPSTKKHDDKPDAFHAQRGLPLFGRLIANGFPVVRLECQHRYPPEMCDLVGCVTGDEELYTADGVENREECKRAKKIFQEEFNCQKRVLWVDSKHSNAEVNPASKSTYNTEHALRVYYFVARFMLRGVPASRIGVAVPYTAQLYICKNLRNGMEKWCREHSNGRVRSLAPSIQNLNVFTVDSIQGGQLDYIIFDTTVTDALKFLAVDQRINLAISRARAGLIIIGNAANVESTNTEKFWWKYCAYKKVLNWCRSNYAYVDLDDPSNQELKEKMVCPWGVMEELQRIHSAVRPGNLGLEVPLLQFTARDFDDVSRLDEGDDRSFRSEGEDPLEFPDQRRARLEREKAAKGPIAETPQPGWGSDSVSGDRENTAAVQEAEAPRILSSGEFGNAVASRVDSSADNKEPVDKAQDLGWDFDPWGGNSQDTAAVQGAQLSRVSTFAGLEGAAASRLDPFGENESRGQRNTFAMQRFLGTNVPSTDEMGSEALGIGSNRALIASLLRRHPFDVSNEVEGGAIPNTPQVESAPVSVPGEISTENAGENSPSITRKGTSSRFGENHGTEEEVHDDDDTDSAHHESGAGFE